MEFWFLHVDLSTGLLVSSSSVADRSTGRCFKFGDILSPSSITAYYPAKEFQTSHKPTDNFIKIKIIYKEIFPEVIIYYEENSRGG